MPKNTDPVAEAVHAIAARKKEIVQEALDYFQVGDDTDRVKILYAENSWEHLLIDGKVALTFSPLTVNLNGRITLQYTENYKKGETKHGAIQSRERFTEGGENNGNA